MHFTTGYLNHCHVASKATQILQAMSAGDRSEVDKPVELVYEDLRGWAHAKLKAGAPNHTLDPTAVVHESSSN